MSKFISLFLIPVSVQSEGSNAVITITQTPLYVKVRN